MKIFVLLLMLLGCMTGFGQLIKKENLTPKIKNYYDFKKTQLESTGSYYKDPLGETTEKHGKWLYYDRFGQEIEERNYFRDKLHGRVLAHYSNGVKKQEGYFKRGLQDSVFREWTETGKLQLEGWFKLGKPVGIWETYYLSGLKKQVEEVLDSTTYLLQFWLPDSAHTQKVINGTGEYLTYYDLGTIKEWYNYKEGLKHGPFEEYSIYGYPLLTGSFVEGKKDSTWNYYYYNGKLEKTSNYVNGILHGEYRYYYDNGQLNVVGQYENGLKVGKWVWYTNKGTVDQEGTFENGKQHGKWKFYYPTGELSYEAEFDHDLKTGTWTYYDKDGGLFKKGTFINDLKDGRWETWYENGNLVMAGNYKKGKEEGIWVNYWENGKEKNIATFKAGKLNGKWVSYYPTGKLKMSGTYKDGEKTGKWIDYFENGKEQDMVTYKIITKKRKAINYGPLGERKLVESVKHGPSISYSQKDYKKIEEGNYKLGEKEGVWYTYWPGGKIPSNITSYKAGKLDGKSVELDRRGNTVSETEYKDGLKHGKMKLYDKRGKVYKELEFEYGQQILNGTRGSNVQFKVK